MNTVIVTSEKFTLINLEEYKIIAAPSLKLDRNNESTKISGSINIFICSASTAVILQFFGNIL
jgi:hypothetical protein